MLRGIYASASGMLVEGLKTDVIANNLANVSSHGFKKQTAAVRSFPEIYLHRINDPIPGARFNVPQPVGPLGTGAAIEAFALDITGGPLRYTGRSLDLALAGPGFFTVQMPNGDVAYTRDGEFDVDVDGYVVGRQGARLLGAAGPITVDDESFHIDDEGNVWIGEAVMDQLVIVEFEDPQALERLGSNLLAPTMGSGEAQEATATVVRSEYLEEANVVVVKEMVELIATQRAYEANQRMVQAHDETLGRLINETASSA